MSKRYRFISSIVSREPPMVLTQMMLLLPPAGASWPRPQRQRWLEAMERIFALCYETPLATPTPTATVSEVAAGEEATGQ